MTHPYSQTTRLTLDSYLGDRPIDTSEVAQVAANFTARLQQASYVAANKWRPIGNRDVTSIRELLLETSAKHPRINREGSRSTIHKNTGHRLDYQGLTTTAGHNRSPSHMKLAVQNNVSTGSTSIMTLIVPKWRFEAHEDDFSNKVCDAFLIMLDHKASHAVMTGTAVKGPLGVPGPDLLLNRTLGTTTVSPFTQTAFETNEIPFHTHTAQLNKLQSKRRSYLRSQHTPAIVNKPSHDHPDVHYDAQGDRYLRGSRLPSLEEDQEEKPPLSPAAAGQLPVYTGALPFPPASQPYSNSSYLPPAPSAYHRPSSYGRQLPALPATSAPGIFPGLTDPSPFAPMPYISSFSAGHPTGSTSAISSYPSYIQGNTGASFSPYQAPGTFGGGLSPQQHPAGSRTYPYQGYPTAGLSSQPYQGYPTPHASGRNDDRDRFYPYPTGFSQEPGYPGSSHSHSYQGRGW